MTKASLPDPDAGNPDGGQVERCWSIVSHGKPMLTFHMMS